MANITNCTVHRWTIPRQQANLLAVSLEGGIMEQNNVPDAMNRAAGCRRGEYPVTEPTQAELKKSLEFALKNLQIV
ncbi:MAG: hypothetical protein WCF90_07675 [Methanomicrobiales archaeon]